MTLYVCGVSWPRCLSWCQTEHSNWWSWHYWVTTDIVSRVSILRQLSPPDPPSTTHYNTHSHTGHIHTHIHTQKHPHVDTHTDNTGHPRIRFDDPNTSGMRVLIILIHTVWSSSEYLDDNLCYRSMSQRKENFKFFLLLFPFSIFGRKNLIFGTFCYIYFEFWLKSDPLVKSTLVPWWYLIRKAPVHENLITLWSTVILLLRLLILCPTFFTFVKSFLVTIITLDTNPALSHLVFDFPKKNYPRKFTTRRQTVSFSTERPCRYLITWTIKCLFYHTHYISGRDKCLICMAS